MPSMCSLGPKALSTYGSLAPPWDGSLGRDSHFLMSQRNHSFMPVSPDDWKSTSRLKLEQPTGAVARQPSGSARKGQFEPVVWGSRDLEPGLSSANREKQPVAQQHQSHKRRSQDSGTNPTASLIEHAAHKRSSHTSRSYPAVRTCPGGRRSLEGGGPGVAPAGTADQAARRASVRRSSSCSDLGNLSAGAHFQDSQQAMDRVQDLDSRLLGHLPNGWGHHGDSRALHHGDSRALQGFSYGWQAQTIEEEELQGLEGSKRSSPKDPQRTSQHGSDAKERQAAKPESSMYHEVEVKLVPDPVTNRPAFLLIQRDVSEQVELENLLAELIEDQLAMLSQVFPRHVIQALTTHGAVTLDNIADLTYSHTDVTILFLDIVSFTSTCGKESVTPESVITFLNVLFSRFDKLVQKHHVQKIDTIGDAYLVASGILAPDGEGFWAVDQAHDAAQGARRMMSLAVDMLRAALEIRVPDHQPVNLRIGLHTGPCVSGLVGLEVPKWSVFGDTVNTAARLEQTAVPGTIQISNATKRLLPDHLDIGLEHNGAVAMKGKGTMETWLWRQPQDWVAARDAGVAPPLPKAIELLHRHCGIDGSDGDANEEELPTVQLPATFLPSGQSRSRQLPDLNNSRAKINGLFSGFTHSKSFRGDSKTSAASRGTSQSQGPSSRDTPTLVRRGSVPSLPSQPSLNGITLDDAKALEKALGSGSSQSPSWNQAPPLPPQTAAPALNKKKDPAISRALHRLTDASITLPLVVTEAMKGLQVQGPSSFATAGSMSARESPPPSAVAMRKPGGEGPPSALTAALTQRPTTPPESPFAAASKVDAAAGACNGQSTTGANKSAPKECEGQRKHVDKLSWAPEPHMGFTQGKSRRRSQASEEESVEARESMDRVGMFGPKVFEILRVASNSPMSSNSQVDSSSFHRINFNSAFARRSARNSAAANCMRRTSSSWHSTASASQFTSFGADWTTLSVRSSIPMPPTTRSLPLPSCLFDQQSESPSPTQAGARGRGGTRQSLLKRDHKGQPRVLQRCHSDPLPSFAALSHASASTRGSQSGLRGHISRSRARHRVSEGAPIRVRWGGATPSRPSPEDALLKLPTKSVQFACDRESVQRRAATFAAAADSSPNNIVRQLQQQVVVGAPSSTHKTGSAGSRGMAQEEGSFSMPLKYKVAAMLEGGKEVEEDGTHAYEDESCEKSYTQSCAAHLVAKLAELPDKPIALGSLVRTSSKRPNLSQKIAQMSAGCNVLHSASMTSPASAIPSGSAFKSLARAQGMASQANALHPSQANALQPSQATALQRCSSITRANTLSRANTLIVSSQANAIFPAAGNSMYKTLAKAHAHIGSGTGFARPSMSFDHHLPTSPELASGAGNASRPSLAQMRQNSGRHNSGRRSSLYRDSKPQSLQP
ncbi:hypothetical protein DUNSADRAFT_16519 [Dunaliella salina]|uniref:Guanylate cyclase domain-containing protein n=1 Tax=Dunaliella salina TaxID=3046 RepID=A0ABQ7G3F1_DUNSA|nr:hypothetical protein DUNSADRAFT_16519 [Dunaliella salina]|eukprot:KAF5829134.1 hypothetical protein DUNSADRAFT_16519 [Dunaliella salina]